MNRDFSQELYYFLLQKERHDMGLIDDETWREHIDGLLETEINLAKLELNKEFGASSAEYDNSISRSFPDEKFWSQDDILLNAKQFIMKISFIVNKFCYYCVLIHPKASG